jgi:hypothetical protein
MTQLTAKGAKALILKMHGEGLSHAEIARRLEAQGYKSPRTGKAISQFGVGFHVRGETTPTTKVKLAPKAKPAAPAPEPRKSSGKAALALAMLKAEDLPEALRMELAERILNA